MGNAVTDGGALSVEGTTRITATGQNVTFDHPSSNLQGPLKITGADVSVTHPTALILGDSTVTGTYDIRTTTGNITDSGYLDIEGNSTFTTDADGADIGGASLIDFRKVCSIVADLADGGVWVFWKWTSTFEWRWPTRPSPRSWSPSKS